MKFSDMCILLALPESAGHSHPDFRPTPKTDKPHRNFV
jgi:hypothetical protein